MIPLRLKKMFQQKTIWFDIITDVAYKIKNKTHYPPKQENDIKNKTKQSHVNELLDIKLCKLNNNQNSS